MIAHAPFHIQSQPDDTTCGPTCLQAVYGFYGDRVELSDVIREVPTLQEGGTLAVFLACHALQRRYRATIYTYNLQMFDPTWFGDGCIDLAAKLRAQTRSKADAKLDVATEAYLQFLQLGGRIRYEDLTAGVIRRHLTRGHPILTGLSATYLYREAREFGSRSVADDVNGLPTGHFVVLYGYDRQERQVHVADPLHSNPISASNLYAVQIERVMGAILLGIVTYDANLLVIEPRKMKRKKDL